MSFSGTAEFFSARLGKLTASRMAAAMDFTAKGLDTAKRAKLKKDLVAERMTDIVMSNFVSDAMRWGLETEADAKAAYTRATGNQVADCGVFDHYDIEWCAATPDGLVNDDGLLETKCPETATHIGWMMAGVVPEEHKPQMLLQLACTGRQWVDFCSYDPRIKNPAQQLFVRRFYPKPEEIEMVEDAARLFLDEVEALFELVTTTEVVA